MIIEKMIDDIKWITSPFADTWEHVQGPGGNTSVKDGEVMLIKASGYTFKNVADGLGMVLVDNKLILQQLDKSWNDNSFESPALNIIQSIPEGLKPSMEFEFHSLLNRFVLHTHSIYVNVITCCEECDELLKSIFPDLSYSLIPYIMPGHPLSAYIYKEIKAGERADVYFLKNHGLIVHGETAEETVNMYNLIQDRIINFLKLRPCLNECPPPGKGNFQFMEISEPGEILIEDIRDKILVPDQSVFFRNKVSATDSSIPVFLDYPAQSVRITGSEKFIQAALGMLKMLYYILNQHKILSLKTEFIPENEVDLLHSLSTEKYRSSIL